MSEIADRQRWSQSELMSGALVGGNGLASIGSGSRGNGTLVSIGGQHFLVDCGFSLRSTQARLLTLGLRPGDLSAVFVSHEHSDHVAGVAALAHKFAIPVYATHGTRKAGKAELHARTLVPDEPVQINGVEILPVTVPHDAREPTQFVFSHNGTRLGVLSDLGHVTPHVVANYQNLDGILMEANHDRSMLAAGRYPPSVKRRVGGELGHLSNEQAAQLLDRIAHPNLHVVIGHVSLENNDLQQLQRVFEPLRTRVASLRIANQEQGHPWVEIATAACT